MNGFLFTFSGNVEKRTRKSGLDFGDVGQGQKPRGLDHKASWYVM